MNTHFTKMAQNNAWANGVLYRACEALPNGIVWAERAGFFGSIERTLNHIYEVDLYYVDALEAGGAGRSVYQRDDTQDVASLGALQAVVDQRLIGFAQGLNDTVSGEMRETERDGEMVRERVDWVFLHLIQHQVHHRGQVHGMLSEAGVRPPQLDDFYLEFGRDSAAHRFWE